MVFGKRDTKPDALTREDVVGNLYPDTLSSEVDVTPSPTEFRRGDSGNESVIDPHARFNGKYVSDRDLRIEGEAQGEIECQGTLIISPQARVRSAIKAHNVIINGDYEGDVDCGGRFEVGPNGELAVSIGDPAQPVFLRSSAKPFQLAPFVASGRFDSYGFGSPTEALAIMAASHSGEDRHVRTVQTMLREGGLSRDVLQCGMHPPFDVETAQRLLRDAEPLTPLRHNCSGKHAGMALHAKAAGWDIDTYWHPDHPVQQLALETVATLADVP